MKRAGGGATTRWGALGSGALARRLALASFWALLVLIAFWTLAPLRFRPETGHVTTERFCAFFALGAALATSYPRRLFLVAITIAAIAVGLEVLQTLAPTRDGRPLDAAVKLAGGLAGAAAAFGASRLAPRLFFVSERGAAAERPPK
jgi:hypothetical protein